MARSMYEAHINEANCKACPIKNHRKGLTDVISEEPLNDDTLWNAVAHAGYRLLSMQSEPYQKRGCFRKSRQPLSSNFFRVCPRPLPSNSQFKYFSPAICGSRSVHPPPVPPFSNII